MTYIRGGENKTVCDRIYSLTNNADKLNMKNYNKIKSNLFTDIDHIIIILNLSIKWVSKAET